MPRLLKSVLLFIAIVVALLAAPLLFIERPREAPPLPDQGLPWQIEVLPDGRSRVFELVLGDATFEQARRRFGQDGEIALILDAEDRGSLEAYYETVALGPLTGKMILTLETVPAQWPGILARARKIEYLKSTSRRITLAEQDLAAAMQARIIAITFIPTAQLSEEIIVQRFGLPSERLKAGDHAEHFLYPERGLDLLFDRKGRELLQYVAPRDFSRLREPLLAAPQ